MQRHRTCLGLEPWSSLITGPILIVNSEEFRKSAEHRRLENLATFATQFAGSFHICMLRKSAFISLVLLMFALAAGSTHPSFSDVFLIIPSFVNWITGLRTPPNRVFTHSLRAVLQFLNGASAKQLSEAAKHRTLEDFVEDIPGTYVPKGKGDTVVGSGIAAGVTEEDAHGREIP